MRDLVWSFCLKASPSLLPLVIPVGLPCAVLFWLLAVHPEMFLEWFCFVIWMWAEIYALPPVMAARKRGKLLHGENVIPWAQAYIACAARAAYFFHPDNNFPISLNLGCFIAIVCSAYTGLVAVGVAAGHQRDQLVMYMFGGIVFAYAVEWYGSLEVAGYYFLAVNILTRISFMATIPHAIRTRDGRYFCDFKLMLFNLISFGFWLIYSIQLQDSFMLLVCVVGTICSALPLLVKILLHPKLFGDPSLFVSNPEEHEASLEKKAGDGELQELVDKLGLQHQDVNMDAFHVKDNGKLEGQFQPSLLPSLRHRGLDGLGSLDGQMEGDVEAGYEVEANGDEVYRPHSAGFSSPSAVMHSVSDIVSDVVHDVSHSLEDYSSYFFMEKPHPEDPYHHHHPPHHHKYIAEHGHEYTHENHHGVPYPMGQAPVDAAAVPMEAHSYQDAESSHLHESSSEHPIHLQENLEHLSEMVSHLNPFKFGVEEVPINRAIEYTEACFDDSYRSGSHGLPRESSSSDEEGNQTDTTVLETSSSDDTASEGGTRTSQAAYEELSDRDQSVGNEEAIAQHNFGELIIPALNKSESVQSETRGYEASRYERSADAEDVQELTTTPLLSSNAYPSPLSTDFSIPTIPPPPPLQLEEVEEFEEIDLVALLSDGSSELVTDKQDTDAPMKHLERVSSTASLSPRLASTEETMEERMAAYEELAEHMLMDGSSQQSLLAESKFSSLSEIDFENT